MKAILLCDFGSTFTKVTAVDPEKEELIGTASAFTTVESDINDGFKLALERLKAQVNELEIAEIKACSSAAGGLRMAVSGLVPELTAEAARTAALGAGAKVIRVFDHEMTDEDREELEVLKPDIFLLTGGTDGGNSACILENAEVLAESSMTAPILVAGNRSAGRKIKKILSAAGKEFTLCPNVMPRLDELNIKPVQDLIREIFLREIVKAKGLSSVSSMISDIVMPTPAAVLAAVKLLSQGTAGDAGIGDLIAVDPGGATTDVYSISDGAPRDMTTVLKGLPEPREKRTVEGDIGMRYSLGGILEAAGCDKVAERAGLSEDEVLSLSAELMKHKDKLPDNDKLQRLDDALASWAVEIAVTRHCGRVEQVYTPVGLTYAQYGKDLRGVEQMVVTGGALVRSPHTAEIVRHAQWTPSLPTSLRPERFHILVDRQYILSAMGVLAQSRPELALKIMKKELSHE